MKSNARIQAIYFAPLAGAQMQAIKQAKIIAGQGIEGDRYALKTGAYSGIKPEKIRHISLITQDGIQIANDWLKAGDEPTFVGAETRRNIVLEGISANDLNALVGKQFWLGEIYCLAPNYACHAKDQPNYFIDQASWMHLRVEAVCARKP